MKKSRNYYSSPLFVKTFEIENKISQPHQQWLEDLDDLTQRCMGCPTVTHLKRARHERIERLAEEWKKDVTLEFPKKQFNALGRHIARYVFLTVATRENDLAKTSPPEFRSIVEAAQSNQRYEEWQRALKEQSGDPAISLMFDAYDDPSETTIGPLVKSVAMTLKSCPDSLLIPSKFHDLPGFVPRIAAAYDIKSDEGKFHDECRTPNRALEAYIRSARGLEKRKSLARQQSQLPSPLRVRPRQIPPPAKARIASQTR